MLTTLSWVDLSLVFGITLMSFAIVKVLGNSSVQTIEPSRQSFTRQFCFEFDHTGKLVCTNEHAREFISDLALSDPDWTTLRETLEHRFEGLPIYVSETEAPIRTSLQPRSAIDPMTVEIEEFAQDGPILHIGALILVERKGQKRILIGDKGDRIKQIGRDARVDMERMFECKVMLKLWVKVKSGWSDDERALQSLGYDGLD